MMYKKMIRTLGVVMSVLGIIYGMYMISFGMTHINLIHKVFELTPRAVLEKGHFGASRAYAVLSSLGGGGSSPITLAQTTVVIGIASCFLSLVVLYYSEKLARNF